MEFLNKYRRIAITKLTFNEFRKFIASEFKNEIERFDGLMDEIMDLDGESPRVVKLYHLVFTYIIEDLDGKGTTEEVHDLLKDFYMHDYFVS